jgi:hypothetical protein
MIKKEFYKTRKDEVNLFKTYSTDNLYIRKIGTDEVYDEVIDVENAPFEYEETEEKIEEEENENEEIIDRGDIE